MVIICHISRIDFARNRVTSEISRGVTGWRVNDAFFAGVNRTVHTAGVLYGT